MSRVRFTENSTLRTVAYIVLALAGILGLWRVETTSNNAEEAAKNAESAIASVEQESLNRAREICLAGNMNRQIILQLVETIAVSSDSPDFTQVPGYEELDFDTQQFFTNLAELSYSDEAGRIVQAARDLLVEYEC